MKKISSISVTHETRKRLASIGKMTHTYDDLINELLDHVNSCDRFWVSRN